MLRRAFALPFLLGLLLLPGRTSAQVRRADAAPVDPAVQERIKREQREDPNPAPARSEGEGPFTRLIIRGVRPELTRRRMWAWRGSSIMLSTCPAMGRSCSRVPPKARPPPVTDE